MTRISALLNGATLLKTDVLLRNLSVDRSELHLLNHNGIAFLVYKKPDQQLPYEVNGSLTYSPFPYIYKGDEDRWVPTGLTMYASLPSLVTHLSNISLHIINTEKLIKELTG